jgi:hypothetical protein
MFQLIALSKQGHFLGNANKFSVKNIKEKVRAKKKLIDV